MLKRKEVICIDNKCPLRDRCRTCCKADSGLIQVQPNRISPSKHCAEFYEPLDPFKDDEGMM